MGDNRHSASVVGDVTRHARGSLITYRTLVPAPARADAMGRSCVNQYLSGIEGIAVSEVDLDAHSAVLGLPGGQVFDFSQRAYREVRPGDLVTRVTPVQPTALDECPIAKAFVGALADGLGGEAELAVLHRRLSAALLGLHAPKSIVWLIGPAGAGKTLIINAIRGAVGAAHVVPLRGNVFVGQRGGGGFDAVNALAGLHGARYATIGDLPADSPIDASIVNGLSGGDRFVSRTIGADETVGTPTHSLIVASNGWPRFDLRGGRPTLAAFYRRLLACPFQKAMPHHVGAALHARTESPAVAGAILGWLIEGAVDYCRQGMLAPTERMRRCAEEFWGGLVEVE